MFSSTTVLPSVDENNREPVPIIGCWRCGADLSKMNYDQAYSHLDQCYGKDGL